MNLDKTTSRWPLTNSIVTSFPLPTFAVVVFSFWLLRRLSLWRQSHRLARTIRTLFETTFYELCIGFFLGIFFREWRVDDVDSQSFRSAAGTSTVHQLTSCEKIKLSNKSQWLSLCKCVCVYMKIKVKSNAWNWECLWALPASDNHIQWV